MNSGDTAYFRPITTVDLVIFALSAEGLEVLTLRRTENPFAGRWALPGGWVHVDEDADLPDMHHSRPKRRNVPPPLRLPLR
jgi:8-oxo-dGTP pyrophosphatase MutT (NUDIX family)